MTVVIACKLWKTIAIIADCRVSYPPQYDTVDDYLQKIYHFNSKLVLGFSGPLSGAYEVIELVRQNLCNYSKPPIADNLQRDIERWIQYRYSELKKPAREGLSFILATVEPKREKPAKWHKSDGKGNIKPSSKPSWFPFIPDWRIVALKPSQSEPSRLVREEGGLVTTIGVKEDDRRAIEETITESYGFAFKQPELQMQAILGFLNALIVRKQMKKVGGLLQAALLSENGIQWVGYAGRNVALIPTKERFIQRNTETGQEIPLMKLWEWARSQPNPGSFGTFEDAGLRKAIENHQQSQENSTKSH